MKKGEQAWYCYGRRTNGFLLMSYGFCPKGNLYDAVKFQLRLDVDVRDGNLADLGQFFWRNDGLKSALHQEIRFKRFDFNETLLAYMRNYFREAWFAQNYDKSHECNLLLSEVVNLKFEKLCLAWYEALVSFIIDHVESRSKLQQSRPEASSLAADLEILRFHEEAS